jgi:hypothetical protein
MYEKQLKNLFEIIKSKEEEETNDAMLLKKPFQGYSCASC